MKTFSGTDEMGYEFEFYQKTQKRENPKNCDGCDKRIKKGMYYTDSDAGDHYCMECSTE